MRMSDGINLEYTEGVVKLNLEIRSNAPNEKFEGELIQKFLKLCADLYIEPAGSNNELDTRV